MNYRELLNITIKKSGLKNVEIISRMKDIGVSITTNYLSVLRNDDTKIASDEVSRALAKVCGVPENLLVVQAGIDKASKELQRYLNFSVEKNKETTRFMLMLLPEPRRSEKIAELENMTIAEIICDVIDNESEYGNAYESMANAIMNKPLNKYAMVPLGMFDEIKIVDENGNVIS